MTPAQPQTIAESLSKRILEHQYQKVVPELVLRGFKRDANKLKAIAPAYAYHVLGQIASLEYNTEEVMKQYDTALEYGLDCSIYYNYAVSLVRVGQHSLALQKLKAGFALLPHNISLTKAYLHAFSAFLSLSYLKEIVLLLEKYQTGYPKMIQDILDFFAKKEIEESVLEELMVDVRETIYTHNFFLSPTVQYENVDNSLNIIFGVKEVDNLEQLFECNDKIADIKIDLEDKYHIDLSDILISCEIAL